MVVHLYVEGNGYQAIDRPAGAACGLPGHGGLRRPVLSGLTERLEYVDAPYHVADLARYRARGYAMAGNRCAVVTDRPEDLVEVHSSSRGTVDLGGLTFERSPPAPAVGDDPGCSRPFCGCAQSPSQA